MRPAGFGDETDTGRRRYGKIPPSAVATVPAQMPTGTVGRRGIARVGPGEPGSKRRDVKRLLAPRATHKVKQTGQTNNRTVVGKAALWSIASWPARPSSPPGSTWLVAAVLPPRLAGFFKPPQTSPPLAQRTTTCAFQRLLTVSGVPDRRVAYVSRSDQASPHRKTPTG